MERTEKRRLERERQKLDKHNLNENSVNIQWYKQLPVSKKIFIGKFVEHESIKNDNMIASIMDKCILSSMDDNTDLNIVLMQKIIKEYNDYILDYKQFLDKYGDGGFNMIEDKHIRENVKIKMMASIKNGTTKVKCMAALKKEFNMPAAELSDMWVKCKEEYMADILDAVKNIEVPKKSLDSCLEIVETTKVIKGRFGYYHISKDGLRFSTDIQLINDDIAYKTKDEVIDSWHDVSRDIENDITIMENKLESLKKDKDIAISKFKELEAAFDM